MTTPDRLAAYLDRLRLAAAPAADADGLAHLQAAHRQAIAFENLDVRLGRPIRIDSERVFDKLVTRRRGGYCFEQNRLFSDMLAALGLPNRPLLARVRLGQPEDAVPPRTHVLLLVDLRESLWLADAGFGGSYVPPLPLQDGAEAVSGDGAIHRLRRIGRPGDLGGEWLLERAGPAGSTDGRAAAHADWQAQYSFDLAPVAQDDLEQCNHWTSTRPETRFTRTPVVSIARAEGFASLTDPVRREHRGGVSQERLVDGPQDYAARLADLFGLNFAPEEAAALPLFAAQR